MSESPRVDQSGQLSLPSGMLALIAALLASVVVYAQLPGGREAVDLRWQQGGVSPVIYPRGERALRFSHAEHAGQSCESCHMTRQSVRVADRLLPSMASCLRCHPLPGDLDAEGGVQASGTAADCATCHASYALEAPTLAVGSAPIRAADVPKVAPPRLSFFAPANLAFSHALHDSYGCAHCHEVGEMSPGYPEMLTCLSCHQREARASTGCLSCHLSTPDGKVKTVYPQGLLAPKGRVRGDDHRANLREDHAGVARQDSDYCESCHTREQCLSCHNGTSRVVTHHPPAYLAVHGAEARQSQQRCESCHGGQASCQSCHVRSGLHQEAATRPLAYRFHPVGFVDRPDATTFHGREARRSLTSCVSCHGEESCIRCHVGVNPHPRDFTRRCDAIMQRNGEACAKCHRGAALTWVTSLCGGP